MRRSLIRILSFSAAHFLIATAFAILTYGTDLDQLRSRSLVNRAAGYLYDFLWYPHDAVIRAIPLPTLIRPGVIPAVLIGASLFWGCLAFILIAATHHLTRRPRDGQSSPDPTNV